MTSKGQVTIPLELRERFDLGAGAEVEVVARRRSPRPSAARFFIGAHAQAAGLVLLTRDPARVRTYFPQVKLIAPER